MEVEGNRINLYFEKNSMSHMWKRMNDEQEWSLQIFTVKK